MNFVSKVGNSLVPVGIKTSGRLRSFHKTLRRGTKNGLFLCTGKKAERRMC